MGPCGWFRGGLVFKAHRRLYHSTLGLRVTTKTKKIRVVQADPRAACAGDWDGSGKSVEDTRTHMDEDFLDDSAFKGKAAQVPHPSPCHLK